VRIKTKKPPWLTRRLPSGPEYEKIRGLMNRGRLHTVCQEAKCPNIWECFSNRTATFLILGDRCTRNCRFCAVAHNPVEPPDPAEPMRVAQSVEKLGLTYVVVTSVTRDDLPDGGAGHFAKTIREIHRRIPEAVIEVLIPDFKGDAEALRTVLEAQPQVLNHNIETVPRLYAAVRPGAVYARSLELLAHVRTIDASISTKSGLMLGLGETTAEIRQTLKDLLDAECRMLTMGQYLQPSKDHLPVARFVPPEEFDQWQKTAFQMGFSEVASGPFVRSSYHAKELFNASRE
jgi:lipoic acid synthetase